MKISKIAKFIFKILIYAVLMPVFLLLEYSIIFLLSAVAAFLIFAFVNYNGILSFSYNPIFWVVFAAIIAGMHILTYSTIRLLAESKKTNILFYIAGELLISAAIWYIPFEIPSILIKLPSIFFSTDLNHDIDQIRLPYFLAFIIYLFFAVIVFIRDYKKRKQKQNLTGEI